MASHKLDRIASDIMRILNEIILNEANDSLLHSITITGCKVSKDLSYAKVYFTSLSSLTKEQITKEVNEASGFFRTEIANNLNLRHTPKLNFVYDDSIEYGNRIENIIKEIHEDE